MNQKNILAREKSQKKKEFNLCKILITFNFSEIDLYIMWKISALFHQIKLYN